MAVMTDNTPEKLNPVSKYAKKELIAKFPHLAGKSDDYINGWWKAVENYLNPVQLPPTPSLPPGEEPEEPPTPPTLPPFKFPKYIKGEGGQGGGGGRKIKSPYKQFPTEGGGGMPQPEPQDKQDKNNQNNPEKGKQDKSKQDKGEQNNLEDGPTLSEIPDEERLKKHQEKREKELEKERAENGGKDYDDFNGLSDEDRMKAIQDILNSKESKDAVFSEITKAKDAEYDRKLERKDQEMKASPLNRFIGDLNDYLKRYYLRPDRNATWTRVHAAAYVSGLVRPGRRTDRSGKVPIINVYFDVSSSWSQNDIAAGKQAVATLDKYKKKNLLVYKLYYFGDKVSENYDDVAGGATSGGPEIIKHIKQTGADNVIIMTDRDTDNQGEWSKVAPLSINGAFYVLWRNYKPEKNLFNYIKSKHTAIYDFTGL